MPRKFRLPVDYHQEKYKQISESHCGPAVIQMLLANVDVDVTQEAVAEAGGAASLIELHGMRVDQLALAVHRLAPRCIFYYKDHSTLDELVRIVRDYYYPVGIEWQGLFEDEDEDEEEEREGNGVLPSDSESEDDDFGHYSIVVRARRHSRQLIIADPYKDYFSQDRIFSFEEFEPRWWDTNEVIDSVTGQPALVMDYHMMFVVVRPNVSFPRILGLKRFDFSGLTKVEQSST